MKRIFLTLFSAFLLYRSIELFKGIPRFNEIEAGFLGMAIVAALFNLFITGVFAFLGFAFPTSKLLPPGYYRIRNPKRLKNFYTLIGGSLFRQFLLLLFWGSSKNRKRFFDGTQAGIMRMAFETQQAEIGHLLAFLVISGAFLCLLYFGQWRTAFMTFSINLIFNFYPIVLQRVHRIRLQRFAQRTEYQSNSKLT